jgi:alpha-tubulin suppressor-like RCC1 family protein
MNLLIIHKDVPDISFIINNILPETLNIIVDLENDNLKTIIKNIQKLCEDNNINNIINVGIVRHNINPIFIQELSTQNIEKVDPELNSWIKFSSFLFRLKKLGCKNIDLVSCNCYTDDWKYIINYYKQKYGINIRSSVNITGSGGDWILESDNIDLVGLYFHSNIINYKYSLESVSAPYDIFLIKNYSINRKQYDLLYGYGNNSYGKFGTGNSYENFTKYTLLNGTSVLYPSLTNPIRQFSNSYMNTLFQCKNNFMLSGNKIEYVNEEYTIWQNYYESDYPFITQTHKRKGGSIMTNTKIFSQIQILENIKYFEVGISSKPELITYANTFEDMDFAAAALAKKYGFKWVIKKKYEEWNDWFEELPLVGSISYADRMLIDIGKVLNSTEFLIISIVLQVVLFVLTTGVGTILNTLKSVLTQISQLLKTALQNAYKLICQYLTSSFKYLLSTVTRNYADDIALNIVDDIAISSSGTVLTQISNSIDDGIVYFIDEVEKYVIKTLTDSFSKYTFIDAIKTSMTSVSTFKFVVLPTVLLGIDKGSQTVKRGLINSVEEDFPSYISYPTKPFHRDIPIKPKNTYTQTPINDGYFIVYLDETGQIWGVGDNTHGQIGPKIFNMQKNYGPGMPNTYTSIPDPKKIQLFSFIIASLLLSTAFLGPFGIFVAVILIVPFTIALGNLLRSGGTAYLRILGGGSYPFVYKLTQNTPMKHVSCGDGYIIALDINGKLYGSGRNLFYQMPGRKEYYSFFGLTLLPDIELFKEVNIKIKHVVCGPRHVAIMVDMPGNDIYIMGDSTYGQACFIDDDRYITTYNHLLNKNYIKQDTIEEDIILDNKTKNNLAIYDYLINKQDSRAFGVKATIVGDTPIRLFIPNNESVLQVCCGLKCTVVLTELRNVYVYGFGFDRPRKVHLDGGVSLTILNTYISRDIQSDLDNASIETANSLNSMISNPSEINIKNNLENIKKIKDNTFTTINYSSTTNNISYNYFDISTNSTVVINATKNIKGNWIVTLTPHLNHISVSINETVSNISNDINKPKFVKIIDDTIILYCCNNNDTLDNVVHVNATLKNITANQIQISSEINTNGGRIIAGTYYFGHNLKYMMGLDYKFNDLNTYYSKELKNLLNSTEFSTIRDYFNFGIDINAIIKLNKFKLEDFINEGFTFKQLFEIIYTYDNSEFNVDKIIDASWAISDYLEAGLTFTDLWTNISFKNLKNKFTIYDYIKEGIPIKELLSQCSWLTVKDFYENNRTPIELYQAGFNVIELLNGGFSIFDMHTAKIPIYEIPKTLGYGLQELVIAGYSLMDIFDASYCTVSELKSNNVNIDELYTFSLEDIRAAGYTLNEIFNSSNSIYYGSSIQDFLNAGYLLSDLKNAGVRINNLMYYLDTLKIISLKDIHDAGYSANELKPFNYSISKLKKAGYTASEMREANYSVRELKIPEGYNDIELLEGGYSPLEIGYKQTTLNAIRFNDKIIPYKLI